MATRDLVRIALFAAIIAALGLVPKFDLPVAGGVPVTAQSMGVMLAGIFLGPRKGALAVALFLLCVAVGMPLLSGGRGGLAPFFGPGGGFILGFVPAAFTVGFVMKKLRDIPLFAGAFIASVIGGIFVDYAFGIPYLAWKANMSLAQAAFGSALFVPGDLIKAVIAGLVAQSAYRAVPRSIDGRA